MNASIHPRDLLGRESFDVAGRPRLVFGAGASRHAGELARSLNGQRALLVTDRGLAAAGHATRVAESLRAAGYAVTVFDAVHENPSTDDVDACLAVAREAEVNLIVGLGGGSAMDTAKGTNFLLTNGGRMQDYWGVGKATKPMLPLIAIPTTTGTGSEMQCAALIADATTHQKMACLDPKVLARIAILDPELTLSQPPRVAACTGIDAVTHAVETAVTNKRTQESVEFSRAAFSLCMEALPRVLAEPGDLPSHSKMQLGAALAGAAIERSMLGAAHAAANPLTARFGVTHGFAVGLMLPGVIQFNATDASNRAAYEALGLTVPELIERVQTLLKLAGAPGSLKAVGVSTADIPALAMMAQMQWTAGFNPRPISEADFAALYTAVLD
jgi:alcohol dehydrogenase